MLRVSVGDRELRGGRGTAGDSPHLAFNEQLVIDRTGLIFVEAVFVCVIETLQGKVLPAAGISAIQEWAVMSLMRQRHEIFYRQGDVVAVNTNGNIWRFWI
ncbi:MAG TPA: hypothetical protein VHS31_14235 [Tepidisphaeraceae bacterium]|nr:hypothetical protein [Tepidisphaeraceae bacterium]